MNAAVLPAPVTVLLVDDHLPFRVAARALLEAEEGFVVAGEADDGEQAVELARSLRPDLVLMDVRMPGIDGIEATRRILADDPTAFVVLLSTHAAVELPADLSTCGAATFLRKELLDSTTLAQLLPD